MANKLFKFARTQRGLDAAQKARRVISNVEAVEKP